MAVTYSSLAETALAVAVKPAIFGNFFFGVLQNPSDGLMHTVQYCTVPVPYVPFSKQTVLTYVVLTRTCSAYCT
jgi:hypothetical protein